MGEPGTLKFEHEICEPSLGVAQSQFNKPTIGKKWTILNRYISVTTDIDEKKFFGFEHTTYHFLMIMFIYSVLDTIVSFFFFSFITTYF